MLNIPLCGLPKCKTCPNKIKHVGIKYRLRSTHLHLARGWSITEAIAHRRKSAPWRRIYPENIAVS